MGAIDLQLKAVVPVEINVSVTGRLSRRRLNRVMEYIHSNLARDVRIESIARAAALSAFHFARAFKRTTGMTPHRYLVHARIERAKELMRETRKGLAEIAVEAGFVDQSHMTNVFRRLTGATPTAFRMPGPGTSDGVTHSTQTTRPARRPAMTGGAIPQAGAGE
jgi:transcriptional regulator GlxA family with amidase domain